MSENSPMNVIQVKIELIIVGEGRRPIDGKNVDAIAQSMKRDGLLQPITVCKRPGMSPRYELVGGAHRLAAARALGWRTINAVVIDRDGRFASAIAENLMRKNLLPLEQADAIVEYARNRIAKKASRGGDQPHDKNISSVAKALGFDRRVVRNAYLINKLEPAIRELLMSSGLHKNASFVADVAGLRSALAQRAAIRKKRGKEAPKFNLKYRQEVQKSSHDSDWDESDRPPRSEALGQLETAWRKSPIEALFSASSPEVRRQFLSSLMP
jgi:ParB/RepB/Spo0J family partition protein